MKEIFQKCLNQDFKFWINRKGSIRDRMKFLREDDRMKEEYLGACLDYVRWGGLNTVLYEMGTRNMINFIQHWIDLNSNNLIGGEKSSSDDFTLPYIKHDKCPRDKKHSGTFIDEGKRIRCAHISEIKLKSSFIDSYESFDKLSQMKVKEFFENEPSKPKYEDNSESWQRAYKEYQRFLEEPTEVIRDVCYAILSDEGRVLSLEEILDRLNLEPKTKTIYCSFSGRCKRFDELNEDEKKLYRDSSYCHGHEEENNITVHSFSGWTLAHYVQKWYEQLPEGMAPVFKI